MYTPAERDSEPDGDSAVFSATAAALEVPCPRGECGAPVGERCRNPVNGRWAHSPCVARLVAGRDRYALAGVA